MYSTITRYATIATRIQIFEVVIIIVFLPQTALPGCLYWESITQHFLYRKENEVQTKFYTIFLLFSIFPFIYNIFKLYETENNFYTKLYFLKYKDYKPALFVSAFLCGSLPAIPSSFISFLR